MRVSAQFTEQGLSLHLDAESDQEKAMLGAVLNQPFSDPEYKPCHVDSTLVEAVVHYDGHWTNKKLQGVTLRVHRQENDGTQS